MFLSAYESIQACQMMEELLGQVMTKLLEAQIHEERTKLWSSIALCQNRSKYARKEQWRRGKQRTAAAVFLHTFGALPEVHFLHAIYHFKDQEVKNLMLQMVHDSELKRRSYSHCKKNAPVHCTKRLRNSRNKRLISQPCKNSLEWSSWNGCNYFISTPNCALFEALDFWLPELWNGI